MFEGPKKAGAARLLSLAALIALLAPRAAAQAPAPPPDESDPAPADLTGENAEEVADLEDAGYGARAATAPELPSTQAASEVDRADLDRRVSTSAPDALRWEPGVAIQQTAHGQASPYVRGLTGQQVLHLFDGVRINHAIYRQGPNQYFFTVDARTLAGLEVERGSASVTDGTDALGGVIRATPLQAPVALPGEGVLLRPRLYLRGGTADRELGGRAELGVGLTPRTGVLFGVGYRDLDLLRSGGVVRHRRPPSEVVSRGDVAPWVPRFEEELDPSSRPDDWRTQLGTGFREATFDARIDHTHRGLRFSAAVYGYRQFDAPRTDQCPPPEAPLSECLSIDEQFRTLAYGALRGDAGPLRDLELVAAYQRHDEVRRRDRPRSSVALGWDDAVDSLQLRFAASTPTLLEGEARSLTIRYGVEASTDSVSSEATQSFTDIDLTIDLSRGQYIDGARYVRGAAFAHADLRLGRVRLSGGVRAAFVGAEAMADPASGSQAVDSVYGALVGRAGVNVTLAEDITLALNVDQGFRAPNLDDLTSRQQVGPGFQFENADLRAERTVTTELGLVGARDSITFSAWGFATVLRDGIQRAVRESGDCPPMSPDCLASRDAFQLVNADEHSLIVGGEGQIQLRLPQGVSIRTTVSYAWGEGPSLGDRGAPERGRVPLSRVAPLQGTAELRWQHRPSRLRFGAALRWATPQGRLAVSDVSDNRIPLGGTPGYAVLDLRAGWRATDWLELGLLVENLSDQAYRVHGSSVLGAGRSARLWLSFGR